MKRLLVLLLYASLAFTQQTEPAPELSLEAIFAEGGLTGRAPEDIKWSPDGNKVSFVQRDDPGERGELFYVDLASGQKAVLVAAEKLQSLVPPASRVSEEERERRQRYGIAGYFWSPDSKRLLFDSRGQLWLYTLETGTAVQLTASADPSSDPKFSPDGKKVAFVRKHDLWVRDTEGQVERRLTRNDDPNVLNGEVDWVYQEELDVRSHHFWSPDGEQILFLQMNETPVPTHPLVDFIPVHQTVEFQKYPQPGDPNPVVRLGVVSVDSGKVRWLKLPVEEHEPDPTGKRPREAQDFYIPRFGWLRPGIAWVQVLNRAQTRLDLYFVDVRSRRAQLVLSEVSEDAWVEVTDDFRLVGGNRFLWSSWRDGHTHLYLYSFEGQNPLAASARLERQLTGGEFEVLEVKAVDEKGGWVYFVANQGDVLQRNVYRVRLDGSGFQRVSRADGSHEPEFNPAATAYADDFSDTMTPPALYLCPVGGECRKFWDSRSVSAYGLVAPRYLDFRAEDGTVLKGMLLLPPGASGKLPLILNPYGGPGPGSQAVRRRWYGSSGLFDQVLLRRGFAILRVDNRGMGGRGKKFAIALRRRFGQVEIKDQLAALEQALQQFPQLDRERVGFWGWSYGGTMTLWAMTRSKAFRAGVSVAPGTDWKLYDTIYTERYMGLPAENPEGYREGSALTYAAGLHGSLLLVHGTGDDNVHVQNSMQMADALIRAGQQFDLMLYPRRAHGISGAQARIHLYRRVLEHFEKELAPRPAAPDRREPSE